VDIGGTFTDLLCYDDERGEMLVGKTPTIPGQPELGVIQVIQQVIPRETLAKASLFLHGTTVGLNALIERRGAVVGLLTTAGFRDSLELRRASRREMYNSSWSPPPPLVPRRLRLPIRERVNAHGEVLERVHLADVAKALDAFAAERVSAIAVVFLHAYANPEHELAVEEHLRRLGFDGPISLSHRVSGEYREYERCSTTVVDAFVKKRFARYLTEIRARLVRLGFEGRCLVMRSGGGSLTFDEAEERPFETVQSGPAAGVEGATTFARRYGLKYVVTADVGGTTFDTALIRDGRPQLLYQGEVAGMPLQSAWIDVRSIGAGGGSVASIDAGGLLHVGPRSAAASPGPASYGKGGTEATTIDAALCLGMLGDGMLASGMRLDPSLAEKALQPLASQLRLSVTHTCVGILRIATSAMVGAMRRISLEKGVDPREAALLTFGGAGPLLATELARALGIRQVVVPPHAGNFSAWGLLGTDVVRDIARTQVAMLSTESLASASATLRELLDILSTRTYHQALDVTASLGAGIDLRYRGQEHTITVTPRLTTHGTIATTLEELTALFGESYRGTYGHLLEAPIEMVAVRASMRQNLTRTAPAPGLGAQHSEQPSAESLPSKQAWSLVRREFREFRHVRRESLREGARLSGPMIIFEPTSTTYVDVDFELEVMSGGCMFLHRCQGADS
jgi:N-methylhydantoinase A